MGRAGEATASKGRRVGEGINMDGPAAERSYQGNGARECAEKWQGKEAAPPSGKAIIRWRQRRWTPSRQWRSRCSPAT